MSGQSDIMNECDMDFVDLEEGDLKMGLTFSKEDIAMKSIQLWSEKTFCPLSKVSLNKKLVLSCILK